MAEKYVQSSRVAARIRAIRKAHGMTQQALADRIANSGRPIGHHVISFLDTGKKKAITLDDLYAFAAGLDVTVEFLLSDDPVCPNCKDKVPRGFVCLACGRG